eukprot:5314046-Prymnesium_polylepis.2
MRLLPRCENWQWSCASHPSISGALAGTGSSPSSCSSASSMSSSASSPSTSGGASSLSLSAAFSSSPGSSSSASFSCASSSGAGSSSAEATASAGGARGAGSARPPNRAGSSLTTASTTAPRRSPRFCFARAGAAAGAGRGLFLAFGCPSDHGARETCTGARQGGQRRQCHCLTLTAHRSSVTVVSRSVVTRSGQKSPHTCPSAANQPIHGHRCAPAKTPRPRPCRRRRRRRRRRLPPQARAACLPTYLPPPFQFGRAYLPPGLSGRVTSPSSPRGHRAAVGSEGRAVGGQGSRRYKQLLREVTSYFVK